MICLALVSYQQKQLMYKMYGENSLKLDSLQKRNMNGDGDRSLESFCLH